METPENILNFQLSIMDDLKKMTYFLGVAIAQVVRKEDVRIPVLRFLHKEFGNLATTIEKKFEQLGVPLKED